MTTTTICRTCRSAPAVCINLCRRCGQRLAEAERKRRAKEERRRQAQERYERYGGLRPAGWAKPGDAA